MKEYGNIIKNLKINTEYLRDNYELIVDLKYEKYCLLTVTIITGGIAAWLLPTSINLFAPGNSGDAKLLGFFCGLIGGYNALWSFPALICTCGSQYDLFKERRKNKSLEKKFK